MNEDRRVRIGNCRDAAEAAVIRSVLSSHGIAVHITDGSAAAAAGLGNTGIPINVWVDRDEVEEATALIQELREGGEAVLVDGEIPADDTAERLDDAPAGTQLEPAPTDTLLRLGRGKRMVGAVLLGLMFQHGTAHLSTRAWKRGLSLAAVQIVGWRHLLAGNLALGTGMVVAAVVCDVIGSLWEINRRTDTRGPVARARVINSR